MTQNVTREEIQALKELYSNQDIIIKKADKGSCICIQKHHSFKNAYLK